MTHICANSGRLGRRSMLVTGCMAAIAALPSKVRATLAPNAPNDLEAQARPLAERHQVCSAAFATLAAGTIYQAASLSNIGATTRATVRWPWRR